MVTERFLDAEPLMALCGKVTDTLTTAIIAHRSAVKGYQAAVAATGDPRRKTDAMVAHSQALAEAVAEGLTPDEAFERVGELSYMSLAFAQGLVNAYLDRCRHTEMQLKVLLDIHKGEIESLGLGNK